WRDYVFGKQTILQLSERYGISQSTVSRKLDGIRVPRIISSSKSVVVLMDLFIIIKKILRIDIKTIKLQCRLVKEKSFLFHINKAL
ncbi:MAG: hypothetical protein LBI45_05475, partial [Bacteroidales bacterium]|nr:hypothetical protein [Bacteroidales bacterium]